MSGSGSDSVILTTGKKNNKTGFQKRLQRFFGKAGSALAKRWQYLAIFAVPVAVMYLVYSVFEVHPYGDNSALVLDLNGQYVYFYEWFRDALHGKGDLIYSWSRNLSGEMFGIFAYYLASPFMLIICLLPRTCMLGAIELMQLAKIGTAAVTFAFYLKRTSPKSKQPKFTSVLLFSTMYALCSYMVVQLMDPMWLDGLIYLPLIFWGVHRLIEDRVMLPYIIPLALMFIAHFYIGYMVGIFTFLYFIYCIFSRDGRAIAKNWLGACGRFIFGTFTAILASAWVLLPVYKSLSLGKMDFSVADFSLRTQFKLIDFTTKLFPFTYDTVRNEGLPMVYCGILAVMLLPLFFLNSKISLKEKVSKGLLLAVTFVIMYIAPVDIAMHGFQVPNWLPYRYSFVFSFLMLVMAFRAFENLDGITGKELGAAMFGILAYIVYLDDRGYEHFTKFSVETLDTAEETINRYTIQGVWFAAIAVFVMYILLYLVKRYNNKIVYGVLCGAVFIELFASSYDTVLKIDDDVSYSKYSSYQDYMIDLRSTVDNVNEYDDTPFFRMEATYHRTVCDPIGSGYYGISHSSSTMNTPVLKGLQKLGYAYGGNYTKYQGSTLMTDAVFDIKYLIQNTKYIAHSKVPEDYSKVIDGSETGTGINVYQNPYALGLGFAVNDMMKNYVLDDKDPFVNQNNLFNYALGVNEQTYTEYMTRIFPELIDTENLATVSVSNNHTKYYYKDTSIGECHEDLVFTMPETSHLYMYFPTMYERKVNVWLAHDKDFAKEDSDFTFVGYFFEGDNYSILDLGEYEQGESVRVRISIPVDPGEAYWSDMFFYTFDEQKFVQADNELKQGLWQLTHFDERHIEGNITVSDGQMLFTTVPYEEGWTVKVDGKTVEPTVIADMFIGVELSPGTHTVSMSFLPNYFVISIIISICGLIITAVIFVFEYNNGKLIKKILGNVK